MGMPTERKLLLIVIVVAICIFFLFDFRTLLTLENLKQHQRDLAVFYANNPWTIRWSYLLVYIVVTSLSLPGATVLTLAGGAMFGVIWATIIVSFASSIGATLAFLAARFLFRDIVQNKWGDRLRVVTDGVEQEGAYYLFALRLVPLFPFFVINLLMGLTTIKTSTFYWVSQIGMLAGTLVYVNAGAQLAKIETLSGVLSPALVGAFALLGLFPLVVKKLLFAYKSTRD